MNITDFLRKKENLEIVRTFGQLIVFALIVGLIIFLSVLLLFAPQFGEIKTFLYAICILSALLIVLVISGGVEISIGDLFKLKKDAEEIKREVVDMKTMISHIQNQILSIRMENKFFIGQTAPYSDTQENLTESEIEKEQLQYLLKKYNPENYE